MEGTFVTPEQLKFLKQMDTWLSKEPWQSDVELHMAEKVRDLIIEIEKKGYYSEGEAGVLNYMREEYIKHKKKK